MGSLTTPKAILLASIPVLIVVIYMIVFGLNIPFLDQWAVVDLLEKQQQGPLSTSDLFAQHNEHRPFFPRLIWLTLSSLTQYNINAQLWLNLTIALGTFVFFVSRAMKTWMQLKIAVSPWLMPLMSLLYFNLGQYESWLQGIQTIMFLGMFSVIVGLFLLAESPSWVNFGAALALGVVANYSMANGLLYWPIGWIVLLVTAPKGLRVSRSILWVACGGICISFFLTDWVSSGHLNFSYLFSHLPEWLIWLLNFLGSPLMILRQVAWFFGLISAGLYILIARHMLRTKQWKPFVPYLALLLFILLTAFAISAGRMEMGMRQATAPRYLTMTAWYWMTLLALLPVLELNVLYRRALFLFLTGTLVLLMFAGGYFGYVNLYRRILPSYQAIKFGQPLSDDTLRQINPGLDVARFQLEFLRQNNLSVYAE